MGQIENPSDDPRQFAHEGEEPGNPFSGIDAPPFLLAIQELLERGMGRNSPNTSAPPSTGGSSVLFEVRGPNMTRTIRLGGRPEGPTEARDSPRPPTMSSFLRPGPTTGGEETTINGLLMAQYLMALLGHRDPFNPAGGLPALDQIISQIMERDSHRPVPAPEETITKLPREVLTVGSATLELDCAVCKDQFKLQTDDPDELVVVTLPCKHPFHQPCIVPWLKSSGTCPVCRFQLVAQPEQHPPARQSVSGNSPPRPTSTTSGPSTSSSPPRPHRGQDSPGFLSSLFGSLTGHNLNRDRTRSPPPRSGTASGSRSPTITATQQSHRRSNSDPNTRSTSSPGGSRNAGNSSNNGSNLPGSWSDDLD
ncbi:hypothetical protein CVT24_009791 [Panaeolus cyanescens]|uniref:RING-type domain-containing protein n=1 Tax=Panaeolus cyanescens TaxID=181874 RepID=A0A409VAE7_9AGAR|nr:hypothetical protein CVT24_009791 [Panaeolus cyanescens]